MAAAPDGAPAPSAWAAEVAALCRESASFAQHAGRDCVDEADVWLAAHVAAEVHRGLCTHSAAGGAAPHLTALLDRALQSQELLLPPPSGVV